MSRLYWVLLLISGTFIVLLSFTRINIHFDDKYYYCALVHMAGQQSEPTQEERLCNAIGFTSDVIERPFGVALLSLPMYKVLEGIAMLLPLREIAISGSSIEGMVPNEIARFGESFWVTYRYVSGNYSTLPGLAIVLTGYVVLIVGLWSLYRVLIGKGVAPEISVISLLLLLTGSVFFHNLTVTPMYPTLLVLGLSCLVMFGVEYRGGKNVYRSIGLAALAALVVVKYELIVLFLLYLLPYGATGEKDTIKRMLEGVLCISLVVILFIFGNVLLQQPLISLLIPQGNVWRLDVRYVYYSFFSIQAGLLYYSTAFLIGIAFLLGKARVLASNRQIHQGTILIIVVCLGIYLLRIPEAYTADVSNIGLRILLRYDINRYVVALYPYAGIGLGLLLQRYLSIQMPKVKMT